MGLRIVIIVAALVLGALGFKLLDQGNRIDLLESELRALGARVDDRPVAAAPPPYAPVPLPAAPRATAPAEQPVAAPSEPRVPVTHAEIAHVESAVLSLLEADRPELREKLRAVVQDEQRTLEQTRREERRERWVARREAHLLEVGKDIGLTDDQRQAILHIMLATRDQIEDIRQSADTPDAINASRTQARALRDQSHAQIRELMSADQYESFLTRVDDDDDDRRGPPRGQRAQTP